MSEKDFFNEVNLTSKRIYLSVLELKESEKRNYCEVIKLVMKIFWSQIVFCGVTKFSNKINDLWLLSIRSSKETTKNYRKIATC